MPAATRKSVPKSNGNSTDLKSVDLPEQLFSMHTTIMTQLKEMEKARVSNFLCRLVFIAIVTYV